MNGVHDMGGLTDFGPIRREIDEPVFHHDWERRVLGMAWSILDNDDKFRFAIERIDPAVYLSASYYERWLTALEYLLLEKGALAVSEFGATLEGWAPRAGLPFPPVDKAAATMPPIAENTSPRFSPGDTVIARNIHPIGHTRLPRYVRGKGGIIDRFLGLQAFPDANALGLGKHLQPVYAVRFAARELWGEGASATDTVSVDLWESYLVSAGA